MSTIRRAVSGIVFGLAALALSACTTPGDGGGSDSAQAKFSSAYQLLVAENYAGARDAFLAILAEDPENAYAHLNLGVAYEELGETELAKSHYALALQNGPDQPIAGTVEGGIVTNDVSTTVGALATQNLTALGG